MVSHVRSMCEKYVCNITKRERLVTLHNMVLLTFNQINLLLLNNIWVDSKSHWETSAILYFYVGWYIC